MEENNQDFFTVVRGAGKQVWSVVRYHYYAGRYHAIAYKNFHSKSEAREDAENRAALQGVEYADSKEIEL